MASKQLPKVTSEDLDLLAELGVDVAPEKKATYTKLEERVIAGFEEIERFVEEHGRLPKHGEDRDIFERRYAIRLNRIWESEEWRELLRPFDSRDITQPPADALPDAASLSDDELLAQLGVDAVQGSLTDLQHVRSAEEIRAAEEIAKRQVCADFADFEPLFTAIKRDLELGLAKTQSWESDKAVSQGDWFVVGGQVAYVAEVGREFKQAYGDMDARLRVVYDNGTESDLLRRSFQKALLVDETSRRIRRPTAGPLFADSIGDEDLATGHIYILRSRSTHPYIAEHREVIHKIGVTGAEIEERIANAAQDPTYLFAEVEVVATYKLANLNRHRLETLIHRFFGEAQLDLEIPDRFGRAYRPREWFVVPLPAIRELVERLIEGSLGEYRYDVGKARVVQR